MKQLFLSILILFSMLVVFSGCGDDDDSFEFKYEVHECLQGNWSATNKNLTFEIDKIHFNEDMYTYFIDTDTSLSVSETLDNGVDLFSINIIKCTNDSLILNSSSRPFFIDLYLKN